MGISGVLYGYPSCKVPCGTLKCYGVGKNHKKNTVALRQEIDEPSRSTIHFVYCFRYDLIMLFLFINTFFFWVAAYYEISTTDQPDLERKYWHYLDPTLVAEGMFSIATIMAFFRLLFIMQLDFYLGPLQVSIIMQHIYIEIVPITSPIIAAFSNKKVNNSGTRNRNSSAYIIHNNHCIMRVHSYTNYILQISLGKMSVDIAKYMTIFVVIILAFSAGIQYIQHTYYIYVT